MLRLFFCCVLFLSVATASAQSADQVLSEARTEAKRSGKNVLLLFHASWCGWCRKMEKAMNEPELKPLFDNNYVIRYLTLYETNGADTPGAEALIKKYKGYDQGIPYFIFFDPAGNKIGDSQIAPGQNVGCPAEEQEVTFFVEQLKKSSKLTKTQLALIAERFRKNKS